MLARFEGGFLSGLESFVQAALKQEEGSGEAGEDARNGSSTGRSNGEREGHSGNQAGDGSSSGRRGHPGVANGGGVGGGMLADVAGASGSARVAGFGDDDLIVSFFEDDETQPLLFSGADESSRPLVREGSAFLGNKTISLFGSVILIVNNISGPGMLALPMVFQQAGWFVPCLVLVVTCIVSSLAGTFLSDAMSRVPGNHSFGKRVEFACIFDEFFGRKAKLAVLNMVVLCLLSQVVSSIVASAQVFDSFIVYLNPNATTFALQVRPTLEWVSWSPPTANATVWPEPISNDIIPVVLLPQDCHQGDSVPFHGDGYGLVITLGYLVTFLTIAPMGFFNLDESIWLQVVSFIMLVVFTGEFLWQFVAEGLDLRRVPAFGEHYSSVVGSVVFNYAFIVTIPSWLNEKREDVSVNKAVWISTTFSTAMYIAVGMLGALAYDQVDGNFLNSLASHCNPTPTRISAFMFASGIVAMSIPVFTIMMRYNLIVAGVCSNVVATWGTSMLPFAISWAFYRGSLFNQIVDYSGQVLNGPVNFLLPILVSLASLDVVWMYTGAQNAGLIPSSWDDGFSTTPPRGSVRCGPLRLARKGDGNDVANTRSIVKPLPKGLHRAHRIVGTLLLVLVTILIGGAWVTSLACYRGGGWC